MIEKNQREDIKLAAALKANLAGIKYLIDNITNPDIAESGLRKIGANLLGHLPSYVKNLSVTGDVSIEREDMGEIPENYWKSWSLVRVDKYGAQIAESLNLKWTAIFE